MSMCLRRTWSGAIFATIVLALAGCGGGSNEQMMPGSGKAALLPVPMVPALPVPMAPANHGIASGSEITVQAGASEEHGNVVVSCPAGGAACDLTFADDGTINYQTAGGEPAVVYVLEPNGLIASTHMPEVFANSDADTLGNLLPTGVTVAPLTSAIKRNFVDPDPDTVTKPEEGAAYLKSIASDGMDGFHVTYVIEGEEIPIHFEASDYIESAYNYRKEPEAGVLYFLWSNTDSFNQPPRDRGTSFHDYFDGIGWSVLSSDGVNNDYRGYGSIGVRTALENLPTGRAAYVGGLFAELWNGNDATRRTSRSRVLGNMVLEADFDDSEISGIVHALRVRAPDVRQYERLADGNTIDISDGRIAEGRFTAQLVGQDTNTGSTAEDSVRGFEGTVLGEFYGPAAEEVGGVLSASRPATATTPEQHIVGRIYGGQHNPTVPEGDLTVLSVAADINYSDSTVRPADAANRVTAIEGDGADGFYVTYQVDGVDSRIHLDLRDHGSHPNFRTTYHESNSDHAYFLFDRSRSFSDDPEFSYFNINGWALWDYEADGSAPGIRYGYATSGVPMEAADLPAGTASYAGRMNARSQAPDNPAESAVSYVRGSLALTADFGASTVDGMIDRIEVQSPGQSAYGATNGEWMIGNGAIASGRLTADLTGTQDHADFNGAMTGHFFGPAAAEVGGVLQGTRNGDDSVVYGYFGGTKQ